MSTTHESKHPMAIVVPPPLQIPPSPAPKQAFSDTELAAAEQLMQLSSSCNSTSALSSSSSSSPLSVTTRTLPSALTTAAEEDSHASEGPQRLAHRYRPLADIYAATNPVDRRKNNNVQVKGNKRKAE